MFVVQLVVWVQPNDKENIIEEKAMHATVFVTAQCELPALTVGKLTLEAEAFRLGGFVPLVVVTAKTVLVAGPHFLP
jgi:hypothetical protein